MGGEIVQKWNLNPYPYPTPFYKKRVAIGHGFIAISQEDLLQLTRSGRFREKGRISRNRQRLSKIL